MFKRKPRLRPPDSRQCESCSAIAIGTVTFIADDGDHSFAACPACAVDALTHPATGVRIRFRTTRTSVEVTRGLLGGAA